MWLAAGQGPSWIWLLHRTPPQPSPGLSLQGCRSPCPGMDQAQKTGGSDGSGEARPWPFLASLPPGAPTSCGDPRDTSHCDPGLRPCLLLTQWGNGKEITGLSSPPDTGLRGQTCPTGDMTHPSCWISARISLFLTLGVWGLTESHSAPDFSVCEMRPRTVWSTEGCREVRVAHRAHDGSMNGHCRRHSSWIAGRGQKRRGPGKGAGVCSSLRHRLAGCPWASVPPSLSLDPSVRK